METDDQPPQSPVAAFEALVAMAKASPPVFCADPQHVLRLLRPFLVNPQRNADHVAQIAEAYGAALLSKQLDKIPGWRFLMWLTTKLRLIKPTLREAEPEFMLKLEKLEAALRKELRPGSVALNVRPVRFLDSPPGYEGAKFQRYRLQIQTLVDSTLDDDLQAVSLELLFETSGTIVDDIFPQPGFSTIGIKRSAGAQASTSTTNTEKTSLGSELSVTGAKLSSSLEATSAHQETFSLSATSERTASRVEQYLVARKIGQRAMWRAVANVGPIDAAGAEYTADFLVPDGTKEIRISVDAKIEWLRAGVAPARLEQALVLPRAELPAPQVAA